MPAPSALGPLKLTSAHRRIDENGRDCTNSELRQPVRADVLVLGRRSSAPPVDAGAGDVGVSTGPEFGAAYSGIRTSVPRTTGANVLHGS